MLIVAKCGKCYGDIVLDTDPAWGKGGRLVCAACGIDNFRRPAVGLDEPVEGKNTDYIPWGIINKEAARDWAAIQAGATAVDMDCSNEAWRGRRRRIMAKAAEAN